MLSKTSAHQDTRGLSPALDPWGGRPSRKLPWTRRRGATPPPYILTFSLLTRGSDRSCSAVLHYGDTKTTHGARNTRGTPTPTAPGRSSSMRGQHCESQHRTPADGRGLAV
ncbi:hypothetical protein VTO73DRAFT_10306 [Trametes versicolor]